MWNLEIENAQFWTGTSRLQSRLMLGNIILNAFERTPRISLHCKLVPVLYREYKNGLLAASHKHCGFFFIFITDGLKKILILTQVRWTGCSQEPTGIETGKCAQTSFNLPLSS